MLICPQCQFENPNTNNFCQKCGTSLTHKTCEECSTQVPIQEEICHNCGAFTGTVWWAIISQEPDAVFLSTNAVDIAEETSLQPVELGVDTESSQPETLPTTPSVSNTSSDSSSLESDNLDTAQSPTSIEPSSDQVQVQTTEVSKIGNQPEQE
ncbi:MAG TPA: protein phosphatase, partial [Cyanobacteria bacterium UBA11162]|nr:protein phosphatase [Cyanobacteria bacterium UBA11162]